MFTQKFVLKNYTLLALEKLKVMFMTPPPPVENGSCVLGFSTTFKSFGMWLIFRTIPCAKLQILTYTNSVFELTLKPNDASTAHLSDACGDAKRRADEPSTIVSKLLLRGQMMLVDEWNLIVFLCTPVYDAFDFLSFRKTIFFAFIFYINKQ